LHTIYCEGGKLFYMDSFDTDIKLSNDLKGSELGMLKYEGFFDIY